MKLYENNEAAYFTIPNALPCLYGEWNIPIFLPCPPESTLIRLTENKVEMV